MLSNWTIVKHGDDISVVSPIGGPGGTTIKNAGRLEQRLLFALADALICRGCGGERTVPTGIDEAPTTTCKNCDGTGFVRNDATPVPGMTGGVGADKLYIVMNARGSQGVVFDDKADAIWTQTEKGNLFGVPCIGEAFRESYGDEKLTLTEIDRTAIL